MADALMIERVVSMDVAEAAARCYVHAPAAARHEGFFGGGLPDARDVEGMGGCFWYEAECCAAPSSLSLRMLYTLVCAQVCGSHCSATKAQKVWCGRE